MVLFFLEGICQAQLTIHVELEVKKLLEEQPIYIATNYNNWEPGDENFQLEQDGPNSYFIYLDNIPERFEYKFTQGNWSTVEGNVDSGAIPNRFHIKSSNGSETIDVQIKGWEAKASYLIKLTDIPKNTPEDASLYLVGNFNKWKPKDKTYKLQKLADGTFQTKVYSDLENLEFKFTRGSWKTVEARESGKARPNRSFTLEEGENYAEISAQIDGWEDLNSTFSLYTFYDLLLLFSVFLSIVLLFVLPDLRGTNQKSMKWLLLLLALSAVSVTGNVLSSFDSVVQLAPKTLFVSELALFLYAPIFFFYIRQQLFQVTELPEKWHLQFIPFLIQMLVAVPFILQTDVQMLDSIMSEKNSLKLFFFVSGFMAFVWNAYYWFIFNQKVKHYKKELTETFSFDYNVSYLNSVLAVQLLVLLLWLSFFILILFSSLYSLETTAIIENLSDLIWLGFSSISFILGYMTIKQPETYKAEPKSFSVLEDFIESTPDFENLEEEELEQWAEKLEKLMEKKKPYTNPKLSINDLASMMDTSVHHLSKVINQFFNKNFFEFVNSYRINDFKIQVQNANNRHLTFLALAYQVGFNSKTSFNRAFKKHTGQTPKEFYADSNRS